MHSNCEQSLNDTFEHMTFPIDHVTVDYTYLFEQGYDQTDTIYLFEKYYRVILEKFINKNEWSILIDLDDIIDNSDLRLIIPLSKSKILMVSMFYEQLLSNSEK